jgi:hypothetical protein
MGLKGVGEVTTRVNRPPATKTWRVEHRWGSMIGDTRDLTVTRTSEGRLYMSYGKDSLEIRADLLDVFVEMVSQAAAWTDEEKNDD